MAAAVASLIFLAGLVAITIGAWRVDASAGLIVGGCLAVVAAWLFRKGHGPTGPTD